MISTGDRGVCGSERSAQVGCKAEARLDQLGSERDELVVPHIQRGELIAADAADLGGFQQGGALLEHAVVIGDHAREARRALHEQLIHEAPARRRVAADDLQVFGCEQDDLRIAGQFGGLDGRAVHACLVRTLAIQLRFQEHASLAVHETCTDDRGVRAVAHHRRIVRDAVRAECGEEGDRLGQIRLALTVAAHEHVGTGAQRDVGDRIVAEVDEAQVLNDHCATLVRRHDLGPSRPTILRRPTGGPAAEFRVSEGGGSAAGGT